MCGKASNNGACRLRRAACHPADSVASVLPWKLGHRPMIRQRSGWPRSTQYCRAILNALSFASDPPDAKKT